MNHIKFMNTITSRPSEDKLTLMQRRYKAELIQIAQTEQPDKEQKALAVKAAKVTATAAKAAEAAANMAFAGVDSSATGKAQGTGKGKEPDSKDLINRVIEKTFAKEIAGLYKGKERRGHMQNFFDCVQDRSEPVSDVFSHHRELSSCHLCNIAMLLKRKIRWDPEQEQIIGDAEASNMLGRPMRAPWHL